MLWNRAQNWRQKWKIRKNQTNHCHHSRHCRRACRWPIRTAPTTYCPRRIVHILEMLWLAGNTRGYFTYKCQKTHMLFINNRGHHCDDSLLGTHQRGDVWKFQILWIFWKKFKITGKLMLLLHLLVLYITWRWMTDCGHEKLVVRCWTIDWLINQSINEHTKYHLRFHIIRHIIVEIEIARYWIMICRRRVRWAAWWRTHL